MSNRWCLTLLGLVTIAGSLIGAAFGLVRVVAEALHDGGDDQ